MEHGFTTIVGGSAAARRAAGAIPRGMEVLLKKAKVDSAFRARLLADPAAAAREIDLNLTPGEREVLRSTAGPVLEAMIDHTFVPKQHVATFLQKSSAAMLALVLGSLVIIPSFAAGNPELDSAQNLLPADLARTRMATIQRALEQYRADHGSYPATEVWGQAANPLEGYAALSDTIDPWSRRFHYEAVAGEDGRITEYRLECLGADVDDPSDNIPCPLDPDRHGFPANP